MPGQQLLYDPDKQVILLANGIRIHKNKILYLVNLSKVSHVHVIIGGK
jgi:hypothetical protein